MASRPCTGRRGTARCGPMPRSHCRTFSRCVPLVPHASTVSQVAQQSLCWSRRHWRHVCGPHAVLIRRCDIRVRRSPLLSSWTGSQPRRQRCGSDSPRPTPRQVHRSLHSPLGWAAQPLKRFPSRRCPHPAVYVSWKCHLFIPCSQDFPDGVVDAMAAHPGICRQVRPCPSDCPPSDCGQSSPERTAAGM